MTSLPPSDEVDPLAIPQPVTAEAGEAEHRSVQAQQRFLRRSFGRWLLMAPLRLFYRFWTRIAAHLFPEDSSRARLAEQVGVALPDRLDMSWVTSSLAVGGRVREEDIARLARAGITRVIDTRAEYRDDEAALNRDGIQLLHIPAADTHPLSVEQLMEGSGYALQQIRDGQRVLIHCEHGVGRSVLLTCAVLVRDGCSVEASLRLVQAKRWQASPNHRQIKRLHEFAEALQAECIR
ncbi:MAG TPA: dual specificity protein phosphatase [Ktedonobacterales bacterium]|jgi:protein tyrosine phosphatase (PTP) superfamily phosphohydrolase (DUF442 family)